MRTRLVLRAAAALGAATLVLAPSAAMAHGEGSHLVPAEGAPTVAAEAVWDSEGGGINVRITTANFTFTPATVGQAYVPGEGHAHLSIDGNDVGRAYSEWVFIPTTSFGEGEHTLEVTLEGSDHKDYMIGTDVENGQHIESQAAFTIPAGAGFAAATHGHESTSSSSAWLWGLGGLVVGGLAVAAVYTTKSRQSVEDHASVDVHESV